MSSTQQSLEGTNVEAVLPFHLKEDDGVKCRSCGNQITVSPSDGTEYGHAHQDTSDDGRCKHRPAKCDPKRQSKRGEGE